MIAVQYDLYVWQAPRDLDADGALALLEPWEAAGGDLVSSPFEPSTAVGWFLRELAGDEPDLDFRSDVVPNLTKVPIWLAPDDPPPARFVAVRLPLDRAREVAGDVFGLATKYDLLVFDPVHHRLDRPLQALEAYASATFWPAGAIRAAVVGILGLAVAIGAWAAGIPIVSGAVAVVGVLLFLLAIGTFALEGWGRLAKGGNRGEPGEGA